MQSVPITTKVVSSNPALGEVYVIEFVSDLQQVGGFFPCTSDFPTNKTDHHCVTEILLKVA